METDDFKKLLIGASRLFIALEIIAVIVAFMCFCGFAFAANQKAIPDGSGRTGSLTILGCNDPGCTQTRIPHVNALGELMVASSGGAATSTVSFATASIELLSREINEFLNDFEYQNFIVAPLTSNNCAPGATMSTFLIVSFSTGDFYVNYDPDGPSVATDALHLPGFANRALTGMDTQACSTYNPTFASEEFSIEWGRKLP